MPNETNNRAVTFARTSGRSQDEKLSHAGQDAVMFSYCKKKGLNVIKSFYEVASGLDSEKRPDFLQMINFVLDPKNNIAHVVFHDLSRFTRSKADPHTYLKLLDEHDIIIHSAHDETTSDDDNLLVWDVRFIFNNQFSETVSELTIRGQSESVKMGNDISPTVTYGYEKYHVQDGAKQRPRWKPHPVHAEHIRLIYKMRDQNHRPMAICNHLNSQGIPAPRGGLWTTGTIRNMLRNIAYIGYSQVGKKSKSTFPKHRRKRELVQNPNAHEAIIPEELFYRVQALMTRLPRAQREPPRSHDSPDPLSDRVKCGKRSHNANMIVANSANGGKKIMCSVKKNSGVRYCDTPDVELDDLLKTVGRALKERLSTPSIIQEQLETLIKNSGEFAQTEKDRQKAIAKRLHGIDQEKTNLMAGLKEAKKDYPENVSDFNKALSALNKEKEQLEQQQKDMDEDTSELIAFLANPEGPLEELRELGEQIDPEDLEVTSKFLKSFIKRVDICGDEATMYYTLPLSNTVETPDGYKTSVLIEREGPEILLEQSAPASSGIALIEAIAHHDIKSTPRPLGDRPLQKLLPARVAQHAPHLRKCGPLPRPASSLVTRYAPRPRG